MEKEEKSTDSGRIDSIWRKIEFNDGSIFCNSRVIPSSSSSSCVFAVFLFLIERF